MAVIVWNLNCGLDSRPWQGVLDTTLCYKVCQWLAAGRWFSLGIPVSPTNKTDHHDITEILLKVALNTITLTHNATMFYLYPPTYNSISATSISWWSDLLVAERTYQFQITDRFNLVRLYRVHLVWAGFELTTLVVIGTDCTGSYKPFTIR